MIPDGESTQPSTGIVASVDRLTFALSRRWRKFLDDTTPYALPRWLLAFILFGVYIYRVYSFGGWYIVSYALGIYLLNVLVDFLSPLTDPNDEEEAMLPTRADEDFKPFIRKVPEMIAWKQSTRALFCGVVCTFFDAFDIPVFWPILLIYFLALFTVSIKARVEHMIKHKYIPFSLGKPKFEATKNSL